MNTGSNYFLNFLGKGSFGEIYTASSDVDNYVPDDAEYVIKIEPHYSGPLFAEINCLIRVGKLTGKTNVK